MSESPQPDRASSLALRSAKGAVAELRRTAPETRAILAGLLLVLGAWVGPGLPDAQSSVPVPSERAPMVQRGMETETVRSDAYEDAVQAAVAETVPETSVERRRLSDDD